MEGTCQGFNESRKQVIDEDGCIEVDNTFCAFPGAAGDMRVPTNFHGIEIPPDSVYDGEYRCFPVGKPGGKALRSERSRSASPKRSERRLGFFHE